MDEQSKLEAHNAELAERDASVGVELVKGMQEFLSLLKSGAPITVTEITQEQTPDGPLTTRRKKVI